MRLRRPIPWIFTQKIASRRATLDNLNFNRSGEQEIMVLEQEVTEEEIYAEWFLSGNPQETS